MSDGAHVVPVPTESEMSHIRGIFQRAADAIVAASELGNKVADLASQVQSLRMEVERVRESNRWLEQQLFETARARDEARKEANEASEALVIARETIHKHETKIATCEADIATQGDIIARLHRESDDHLERALKAEDELTQVKLKLEEAVGWIEDFHERFGAKKAPEVVAEPFHPETSPAVEPDKPTVGQDKPTVEPLSAPSEAGDTRPWPTVEEEEKKTGTEGFRW